MNLMLTVLKPLALFLVTQELDGGNGKHAGPPFNYYSFQSPASAHAELNTLVKASTEAYPDAKGLKQAHFAATELFDLGKI
jgi:hypothetical protein